MKKTSSLSIGTDELRFCVTSDETGGALLAVEVRMPPGGGPPGLHRHDPAEVYRVERGELAVYLEGEAGIDRIAAPAGSVVHIPAGRFHTVRNESDADALAYVVFAPGAPFERFARAAAAASSPGEVMALAERHGIEMAER